MNSDKQQPAGLSDPEMQTVRRVRSVTVAGLLLNLFLLAFKFWAGLKGGSKAVTADAFHTLTDLSTDIAIILGVKWWMLPPDKCHPYGHRRIEALITLFIGSVLCLVGVWLGVDGIIGLKEPHDNAPGMIALVAALVSMLSKEIMYRATAFVGRREKSKALLANAWHHRSDAISSLPAFAAVGLAIWKPQYAFVDHVGELLVAVIIMKTAWSIAQRALVELSDGVSSPKDYDSIEGIVKGVKGVTGVHAIRCRRAGPGLYVDMHLNVDADASVKEGHAISEDVQAKLMSDGPDVVDIVVHIEPDADDE